MNNNENNLEKNSLVIGILGGMGSYATIDFFKRIVDAFPAKKEWERPRIIIDNRCTMPSRVRAILYNERKEQLIGNLSSSVKMLIDNGATHIILACNTSHVFLDDVYKNVPESKDKIINIIEECAKRIKEDNIKKIFLMATEGTILSNIYENIFSKYNIDIISPTEKEFLKMRDFIEAVKQNNMEKEIKEEFIKYINNVDCNSLILGCTELPVLYKECKSEVNKKIYDPLQCVIDVLKNN